MPEKSINVQLREVKEEFAEYQKEACQLLKSAALKVEDQRQTISYQKARLDMFDDMMKVINIIPRGYNTYGTCTPDIISRIKTFIG